MAGNNENQAEDHNHAECKPEWTAWYLSHTHWDREWYGSLQQFRYRLVRLVDTLMDLLDADPDYRCFNLDGQTVVLDDYLDIKSHQRARLDRFIKEKRILVGPWYILPDEWLVSGESTIRNWMAGRSICRQFGIDSPNVGYLPDMFGHIGQMPQILDGLGMDNAIFWRGLSDENLPTELCWQGTDGTSVLGIHIPEYSGYGNAALFYASLPIEAQTLPEGTPPWKQMSEDVEFSANAMRAITQRLMERSGSKQLLLMNGIDHMEPQPQTVEILRRARELFPAIEFRHASLEEFVQAVKDNLPPDLDTVVGEHRHTVAWKGSGGIILQNILSSRIQLKQANARCQTLMERWVEPFGVFARTIGLEYPRDFIHNAWKMLLKNHPHDSIGGCSIDEVHYQMEARFSEVEDLATVLTKTSLHQIANAIDTSVIAEDELAFVLFNPLSWSVTDLVPVTIEIEEDWLKARGVEIHPDNIYRGIRNLRFMDWDGREIDISIQNIELIQVHRPWSRLFAPLWNVVRFTAWFNAENVPAVGYRSYRVGLRTKTRRLDYRHGLADSQVLENEFLRLEIAADGTVELLDKTSDNPVFRGLHYFEDSGDNGDGYNYSPPRHDQVVTSRGSRIQVSRLSDDKAMQAIAIDYLLDIPEGVTSDRQRRSSKTAELKIRSIFRIGQQSHRVDVETTFKNPARDHRLQVCFPVPGKSDFHSAEMQFDIIQRPNHVPQPPEDIWMEDEPLECPNVGFVNYENLAIGNFGLPEYEPVATSDGAILKLTLLRAVNFLGAGGHANTIWTGAGPHIETPQQQAIGREFIFHYSMIPHGDASDLSSVQQQAHQHNAMWQGIVTGSHSGNLPAGGAAFVTVHGKGIILSSIKEADEGESGSIIRVWNSGQSQSDATITWRTAPSEIWLTNLAETKHKPLVLDASGSVILPVNPKQIVTLGFK